MTSPAIVAAMLAVAFSDSKTLATQIELDKAGFSPNTIDGQWGRKSQNALERYCEARSIPVPATPEEAFDALFSARPPRFRKVTVTKEDIESVAAIPESPAERAKLACMGYETVAEMLAERGHVTVPTLRRLNPGKDLDAPVPGTEVAIPDFPTFDSALAGAEAKDAPKADRFVISLSRFEIAALDGQGRTIALFPCSIAKDKAKLPASGDLKVVAMIPNPNYTYKPDYVAPGAKARKHVWPPGANCPVGVAWIGLNIPGYGIHGTPRPETIGRAESHGCFRLANWNAARLYSLCRIGTVVTVEE